MNVQLDEQMSADVIIAKCVSIAIIFSGSLVCGLLPAFRVFSAFPRFALSLILSFGGGILIATSLVHILPEVGKHFNLINHTTSIYFTT